MIALLKKMLAGKWRRAAAMRLEPEASQQYLCSLGILDSLPADGRLVFRRVRIEDMVLDNLSLPGLEVIYCELEEVSWINSNLSGTVWRGNAFFQVDFTGAGLTDTDWRCSYLTNINFYRADLRNADLRHTVMENCNLGDAMLDGAQVPARLLTKLDLTARQLKSIVVCHKEGAEPDD